MKTTKIILCFWAITFLFACSSDPKKELEKNIQTSLEIYLKAQIDKDESLKGAKLDSLVITKIDTVTPLYETMIYQVKISSAMEKLKKSYESTRDIAQKKEEMNNLLNSMGTKSDVQYNTSDEVNELKEMQSKYTTYQNRVDSCQKIIDNPKTDNKTIVGYYAFFRLKITKSDMTQETLDAGGIQLTKDYRIIENNLKE